MWNLVWCQPPLQPKRTRLVLPSQPSHGALSLADNPGSFLIWFEIQNHAFFICAINCLSIAYRTPRMGGKWSWWCPFLWNWDIQTNLNRHAGFSHWQSPTSGASPCLRFLLPKSWVKHGSHEMVVCLPVFSPCSKTRCKWEFKCLPDVDPVHCNCTKSTAWWTPDSFVSKPPLDLAI